MDKQLEMDMKVTARRLREVSANLGAVHVSATRVVDSGGPDYRERIKQLMAETDALAGSIEDCAAAGQPIHGRAGYGAARTNNE